MSSATSLSNSSSFISVKQQFGAAFQQILRELALRFDELVDLLLYGSAAHEFVHQHVLRLADAKGAVGGLVLHRRIPPAVEMHDMRGGGQIEARAAGFERKHEEPHGFVFLKSAHQILALLDFGLAVQNQAGPPEDRAEESGQRRSHLAELGEDEHLLLLGRDHLGDLAQTGPLAAVVLAPRAVAQPLRRMIADLFEAHQERQHETLALNSWCCPRVASASSFTACS